MQRERKNSILPSFNLAACANPLIESKVKYHFLYFLKKKLRNFYIFIQFFSNHFKVATIKLNQVDEKDEKKAMFFHFRNQIFSISK